MQEKRNAPLKVRDQQRDFPGGPVISNTSANAGDKDSILGTRGSQMTHSNWANVPQTTATTHLEPMLHNKRSHHNEKPLHFKKE